MPENDILFYLCIWAQREESINKPVAVIGTKSEEREAIPFISPRVLHSKRRNSSPTQLDENRNMETKGGNKIASHSPATSFGNTESPIHRYNSDYEDYSYYSYSTDDEENNTLGCNFNYLSNESAPDSSFTDANSDSEENIPFPVATTSRMPPPPVRKKGSTINGANVATSQSDRSNSSPRQVVSASFTAEASAHVTVSQKKAEAIKRSKSQECCLRNAIDSCEGSLKASDEKGETSDVSETSRVKSIRRSNTVNSISLGNINKSRSERNASSVNSNVLKTGPLPVGTNSAHPIGTRSFKDAEEKIRIREDKDNAWEKELIHINVNSTKTPHSSPLHSPIATPLSSPVSSPRINPNKDTRDRRVKSQNREKEMYTADEDDDDEEWEEQTGEEINIDKDVRGRGKVREKRGRSRKRSDSTTLSGEDDSEELVDVNSSVNGGKRNMGVGNLNGSPSRGVTAPSSKGARSRLLSSSLDHHHHPHQPQVQLDIEQSILQRKTRARARSQPPSKDNSSNFASIPTTLHNQMQTTESLTLETADIQQKRKPESLPELQLADHLAHRRNSENNNGNQASYEGKIIIPLLFSYFC